MGRDRERRGREIERGRETERETEGERKRLRKELIKVVIENREVK